jgi:hypothetical protein
VKALRRIIALATLITVALRGIVSFLSWFEKQEEVGAVWAEEEEYEEFFG